MLNNVYQSRPSTGRTDKLRVIIAAPLDQSQPVQLGLPPGNPSGVEVVSSTRDAADLPDDIGLYQPQIVIVSPDARNYTAGLVSRLANWPDNPIAVVGLVPLSGTWGQEMAAEGAVAFYNPPITPAIVQKFTSEAQKFVDTAREGWSAPVIQAGASRKLAEGIAATAYRQMAVAVWSTKGGDGKTTLTTEVATILALLGGKRVLVIDGNMNTGHVALHLSINPEKNSIIHLAADYRANGNRLTSEMIARRVVSADAYIDPRTRARDSRLDVLLGITFLQQSTSPELFGEQGERFMTDLLGAARQLYDFVLIDLGSSTQVGPHWGALTAADLIVMVCTADRASIYFNRETFQNLLKEGPFRPEKFRLVINRYSEGGGISLPDISTFMGMPIFAAIPDEKSDALLRDTNEGKPFVINHLAHKKNGGTAVEGTVRGMLKLSEGIFPPLGQILDARERGKSLFSRIGLGTSIGAKVKA
jgi:MinD-like ATPase involved in chromosome partitioning or flagellar assembly